MKIALIFAMEAEARPLIGELGLQRDSAFGDSRLPFEHYRGNFKNRFELLLSVNGKCPLHGVDSIGTEPAALNAYVSLAAFQPDLCINAGTAGGFLSRGGSIGDVYLSTEPFRFHDRRIPIPGGFQEYGIGSYPSLKLGKMAVALGLKQGAVTTGNSLDCSEVDREMIEKNRGHVKEMEAAGIAWVAHLLKTPFFAVKAVTDLVDGPHPTQKEFLENLATASRSLQSKVSAILGYLADHPDDLAAQ